MFGYDETLEKNRKVLETVKAFIANDGPSMIDLAKITGYSSSSVQRYLNDPLIKEELGEDVYKSVQNLLARNKKDGLSKGGQISTSNNYAVRDNNGHFTGNKRR